MSNQRQKKVFSRYPGCKEQGHWDGYYKELVALLPHLPRCPFALAISATKVPLSFVNQWRHNDDVLEVVLN